MRIDVHTHIFPPDIVRDRARFFEGEPIFKLLYDSPKAKLAGAESLLETMDRDGIDHAVVFGFPWQEMELAVRHNNYVLEMTAKYGSRLIPLGCFNPLDERGDQEAERCFRSGARGLGELAIYGACKADSALKCFEPLIECCRSHAGIMLVHANEPVGHSYPGKAPLGLDFYYSLAKLAAGTPLILAHWGGGLCFYELLKREAQDVLSQVYYDTAASPFLYDPKIYPHMSRVLRKGKILFGSDYPLLAPRRYFKEMAETDLSAAETADISGKNAAHLFGIPTRG
ncbi:amidohydrolase family protein [Desulforhabdus amnigena]|jgi:predicted TIM-barrel fold metal-dependent hydrolase|uniref:Amidohydrolase-related domain-containing protein n=1 Tax=Desulforhabdus amnigena TaxID=40218 RepID=A0A9W6FWR0_9BACT|nr:amidohydrolase family protein [Desulforhabdus amnigena]NLJ28309.1 amidohydrolase family protein [Deltaproteobacteria bacterium]GLI36227.1 hypothetical protein DAMNIGENAA_36600 [Desulforhabdus amnigena]